MTAQPKPNDPSMEDILSSIRRIIADDQAKAVRKPDEPAVANAVLAPAAASQVLAEPVEDVLELTAELQAEPETEYNQDDVDLLFREIEEEQQAQVDAEPYAEPAFFHESPAPAMPVAYPAPPRAEYAPPAFSPHADMAALISPQVGASVSGAFSQLAHTVLSQNARTLDDLVQEMLKPMLKGWLDENLPTIVERLVRSEIERVARGGRG